MLEGLRPVALGNDVELLLKTLKLLQVILAEDLIKLVLNLLDLALAGDPVQVFNAAENFLHDPRLGPVVVHGIDDLRAHLRHFPVERHQRVRGFLKLYGNMLRDLPFIFILQMMLRGRPEVHAHGADLDLHLDIFRTVYGLYLIQRDDVIAAVAAFFLFSKIILAD